MLFEFDNNAVASLVSILSRDRDWVSGHVLFAACAHLSFALGSLLIRGVQAVYIGSHCLTSRINLPTGKPARSVESSHFHDEWCCDGCSAVHHLFCSKCIHRAWLPDLLHESELAELNRCCGPLAQLSRSIVLPEISGDRFRGCHLPEAF